MTRGRIGLGLVLLLGLCAVPARADWDRFDIVYVPSGQDAGEVAQLNGLYVHPAAGHAYGETWSVTMTELYNDLGVAVNTIRGSFSGSLVGDSSVLLCRDHNTRCSRTSGFDGFWPETDLTNVSAPPGYYEYKITGAGAVYKLFRAYHMNMSDDTHGGLVVNCVDGDNGGAPLGRCVISLGASSGTGLQATTEDLLGRARIPHLQAGALQFWVQHDGYTTGQLSTTIIANQTQTVNVVMHVAAAPTGGSGGSGSGGSQNVLDGDWWSNLFTSLFVPPQATWDEWSQFKTDVTSWGPFGFISGFFSSWGTAARSGEDALVFDCHFTFAGGSQHLMDGQIDLRPALETGTYEGGGRGSPWGTMLDVSRTTEGFGVYVLFAIALFRWMRPRLST